MDNLVYESSTIILMLEGFTPILIMGKNEAEKAHFKSIRTTRRVNKCKLSSKPSFASSEN